MKFRVMVTAEGAEGGSIWRGAFRDFRCTGLSYILPFDEHMITCFICAF